VRWPDIDWQFSLEVIPWVRLPAAPTT